VVEDHVRVDESRTVFVDPHGSDTVGAGQVGELDEMGEDGVLEGLDPMERVGQP
jgi:hypothetical protein